MSHKATLDVQFKDLEVLEKVLADQKIEHQIAAAGEEVTAQLYQGAEKGVATLKLPQWRYPIVVKADGSITFDNYNGHWGDLDDLNKVRQDYALGVTTKQASRQGLRIKATHNLADGTIQLRLGK